MDYRDMEYRRVHRRKQWLKDRDQHQLVKIVRMGQKTDRQIWATMPLETALALCQSIRQEQARWSLAPAAWRCRICQMKGSKGIPARINGQCTCPNVAVRFQPQAT